MSTVYSLQSEDYRQRFGGICKQTYMILYALYGKIDFKK
jgi:hypothetical protein